MPVVWRTTVHQWEVEAFQERVLQGSENIQPPKRAAPRGGQKTPAKRRKVGGICKLYTICTCMYMYIPSEAAQCFFYCLPSDFALLASPCLISIYMYEIDHVHVHLYKVDYGKDTVHVHVHVHGLLL